MKETQIMLYVLSDPKACQVLSKFRTLAHTTPLAWNVLPLNTYIVGSFTSLPHFLRDALPNHPNQRGFSLPSVSHSLSLCSFSSEHLQDVPIGVLGWLSGLANQLGFDSGHDLRVMRWSLTWDFTLSAESA